MHQNAHSSLFERALILRERSTESEKFLWEELRNKKSGVKFRRQHPLGIYILDFYCHELKLVIELDGKYHDRPEQKELDNIRTENILASGLTEIRFTNEEVISNLQNVLNRIKESIVEIRNKKIESSL